jgi:hypothetical protein
MANPPLLIYLQIIVLPNMHVGVAKKTSSRLYPPVSSNVARKIHPAIEIDVFPSFFDLKFMGIHDDFPAAHHVAGGYQPLVSKKILWV